MKKIIFLLAVLASLTTFGQTKQTKTTKFHYRVGIVTGVPMDVTDETGKINTSSTMGEVSYKNDKFSKKISITGNAGYLRFEKQDGTGHYAKIPVMVGLRYPINEIFYFGASAGPSLQNRKSNGSTEFVYSPHIGMSIKKISVDLRYLNFTRKDYVMKTMGLVFSYSL